MSPKKPKVTFRGLVTDPSAMGPNPDGSFSLFTNGVLTRPNLAQLRRGVTRNATSTNAIDKLINYDAGFLAHTNTQLKSLAAGVLTTIGGIGSPIPTNGRLRTCIAGKNLYTAGNVVGRLSGISSAPAVAGGIFAPGFDREATVLNSPGTQLADGFGSAYRYLFGFTDAKGNLHLGEPSGRLIVNNTSGLTTNPVVRAYVPSSATTSHFVQFYRSGAYANGTQPDDDLQLVFEQQLTAADLSNGYVILTDIVPDNLRGAYIYTAPNAGEGILAANRNPPQCVELCAHQDRVFFGGTVQPAEFLLNILGVGGSLGIQLGDLLTFANLNNPFGIIADTSSASNGHYKLVTTGSASSNIEQTAQNICAAINKHSTNTEVWAQYVSGPTDVPGSILFRARLPGTQFSVTVSQNSQRDCFSPQLPPSVITGIGFSLTRTLGTTVTATVSAGTQNFKVGEKVLITPGGAGSGGSSFGVGPFQILTVSTTTFTYAEAGTNGTLAAQGVALTPADSSLSELEDMPNRVYYSKIGEYEATTRNGWIDVGSPNDAILAMKAQRGQIWVWKTNGIYRILGSDESDFRVEALDASIRCRATESVVLFANRCWGLTDRGVVAVSESGLEVMSKAITNDLRVMMAAQVAVLERDCFAVAYESEAMYCLFIPPDRDLTMRQCRFAYTYQLGSQAWSYWDFGANNGKRCGVVNAVDDLMYLGDNYNGAGHDSYIYQERKSFTAADFQDTTGVNATIPIAMEWQWLLQTADAPGSEKRFDELEFLFVSGQAAFSLTAWTQDNAAVTITAASQGSNTARIWLPAEVSRGTTLTINIVHAVAAEAFDLAGLVLSADVLDGAPTR